MYFVDFVISLVCRTRSCRCQYTCPFTKSSITSQPTSQPAHQPASRAKLRVWFWPRCISRAQAYSATLTTGSPSRLVLLLACYARSQQKNTWVTARGFTGNTKQNELDYVFHCWSKMELEKTSAHQSSNTVSKKDHDSQKSIPQKAQNYIFTAVVIML